MHFAGGKVELSLGKKSMDDRVADYLVISINLEVFEHDSRWLRELKKLYMHVK